MGQAEGDQAEGDTDTAGRTFGVEEEFLLVAADTGRPAAVAPRVLARASAQGPPAPGAARQAEMLTTQIEAATGICTRSDELREHLATARGGLAEVAAAEGARLLSVGMPVLEGPPPPTTPTDRYERISDVYAGVVADYQACGCHVHVGVPDRESAVAVVNRLRPWLPTLLAISVNSPFERGRDTGCHSWRMVAQSRFPGGGVPPWTGSQKEWDGRLGALVECGVLMDERMTFWLARPSGHLPTVEVRAADAALTVDEAVLQALLTRAMVRTALAEHREGRPEPVVRDVIADAALWSAARYGLDGPGVDAVHERQVPAVWLVRDLLAWIRPALEELGDLEEARALLGAVTGAGTGALRQRTAAAGGGIRAVLDLLAESTSPGQAGEWGRKAGA
ncbi:carboxylate-amine ligase [Wenjunlia tyrosinilytica]|uniref:Putative glutamate--cysteine ligase 2 n=1 Tax=Wenjunlia tyrosinilytica TaxID=1544741 RepID=A0A917ZRF5_9ACTN|nr:glutamate--cysteine ligase [Wenjunlia tyrosinilytica]GGO91196.1 putative glutamate--cysteine ligase 2 [Wenjunlia tyrosinilytica]